MAQFGRALRSGRRGRVFESRHPDPVGNLDIFWNPAYVKVNKFFLEENNLNTEDTIINGETWKTTTITVDSTKKSRYEFQLFKAKENISLPSPSDYIKCKFTKALNNS